MASLYGAAIRRSALVVCMPFDRGPSCQTLSTAGAKSLRISPSIRFGVLIIPKKLKQEQNIGRAFKVHRKNARKNSIEKAHLNCRTRHSVNVAFCLPPLRCRKGVSLLQMHEIVVSVMFPGPSGLCGRHRGHAGGDHQRDRRCGPDGELQDDLQK